MKTICKKCGAIWPKGYDNPFGEIAEPIEKCDDCQQLALAKELDAGHFDVTSFEASVLETVLKYGRVSEKQARILREMEGRYL